jgi:hypothetical protein
VLSDSVVVAVTDAVLVWVALSERVFVAVALFEMVFVAVAVVDRVLVWVALSEMVFVFVGVVGVVFDIVLLSFGIEVVDREGTVGIVWSPPDDEAIDVPKNFFFRLWVVICDRNNRNVDVLLVVK